MVSLWEEIEYDDKRKPRFDLKSYAQDFHDSGYLPSVDPELPSVPASPPERKEWVPRQGFVYYCTDGQSRVKIGFSGNPRNRCKEMRCFNPDVKLIAIEAGPVTLEHERHQQFAQDHLTLEWFKLSPAITDHISGLKPI